MQPVKPLVSQFVSNFIAIGIFVVFFMVIAVALFIAWNQIVHHSGDPTNYAAEFTGIINNIIVYLLGLFSGVIGVLYNIKPDDQAKILDQATKVSKDVGMEGTVNLEIKKAEAMDKLEQSPNADQK